MKIRTIRKRREPERDMQVALFKWAALSVGAMPSLRRLFAVPNGGRRDYVTAARMKAEGVKPGVPDVCLPVPGDFYDPIHRRNHHFGSLWIELKAGKNSCSAEQRAWIAELRSAGNAAVVVRDDWMQAQRLLEAYLLHPEHFPRLYALQVAAEG